MNLPNENPWGVYKRQIPIDGIISLVLQVLFVVVIIGCAYYALKCKPFQSVSFEPAHPVARHNRPDEGLLSRVKRVAPLVHISLTAGAATHKKLVASR